jgi:tetratricopeptide (TPR) repeat protein
VLALVGCEEQIKKGERYMVDPSIAETVKTTGLLVPMAGEIDLVETLAGFRNSYRSSVVNLMEYYRASGNNAKYLWAQAELKSLDSMAQYRYVTLGDTQSASLRANDTILKADALYAEGMSLYGDAKALIIITDKDKLQQALRKFDEIIRKYPTSDKIDEAAYRSGRIYQHFKDYEIAVVYYQRTFQWNDETPFPVRYKSAYILDRKLNRRKEALVLYQMALKKEQRYIENMEDAQMRVRQLMTSDEKSGLKLK